MSNWKTLLRWPLPNRVHRDAHKCRELELDVVIDANIFGNAIDVRCLSQGTAIDTLTALLSSSRSLALDDTGGSAPASETSHLYLEYQPFVHPGSVGAAILTKIALQGRLIYFPSCTHEERKQIEKLIPRNKKDRRVLGIGVASESRLIVTNDFSDFDVVVRKKVKKQFKVNIIDSGSGADTILSP